MQLVPSMPGVWVHWVTKSIKNAQPAILRLHKPSLEQAMLTPLPIGQSRPVRSLLLRGESITAFSLQQLVDGLDERPMAAIRLLEVG